MLGLAGLCTALFVALKTALPRVFWRRLTVKEGEGPMHGSMPDKLTPKEIEVLRRLLGIMVPADSEHGLPSADDPLILQDSLSSLGRDAPAIRIVIAEFLLSGFLDLPAEQAETKAMALLGGNRAEVQVLSRLVAAAY